MLLVAVGIGSLIVGAALGIAFRVLVLIPATLIAIAIAPLRTTWSTAEVMLVAWVGAQVGYLGCAAARMRVDLGMRKSRPDGEGSPKDG
jgi:hypothetical protein